MEEQWVVALYANGQNNLNHAVAGSLQKIAQTTLDPSCAMAIQSGSTFTAEGRLPVSRYRKEGKDLHLVQSFDDMVMAEPRSLYDFLLWVFHSFPKQQKLLILSGHGLAWLGILPTMTPTMRPMMTLQSLGRVIEKAIVDSGAKLAGIVFDTCYMNSLEALLEFHHYCPSIEHLLLSYGDTPPGGLSLPDFMQLVSAHRYDDDRASLFSRLERGLNEQLPHILPQFGYIYVRPAQEPLQQIKKITADFAPTQLAQGIPPSLIKEHTITIFPYGHPVASEVPAWLPLFDQLSPVSRMLLGHLPPENKAAYFTLNSTSEKEIADFYQPYYEHLLFAQENSWLELQGMVRGASTSRGALTLWDTIEMPQRMGN
ncbi:clostripain-related cysteine peptidase [Heliophilum fasciatum]|uniref:Cysteine peptidase C11 family protein n=1 Tax=Heliophilum fasciatum TaxID=35700 RepID=A0A4R2S1C8_9FIRM|nr:clostripain-related cysteine peptidase [Heliophilum fasciatum]MCW2276620.1 hypothetical protein [Heliophilum fasciatum]TCP68997.1 cysteine peptidase C11 family protein [Heliophilum fasciatum]